MDPLFPKPFQLRVPPLGLRARPPLGAGKYAQGTDGRRIPFYWFSGLNVVGAVLALRSHSRPDQTPFSQRNRILQRPREQYASRTGRKTPTNPRVHRTPGRTQEASSVRDKIKNARRPQQLQNILERTQAQGKLDSSVLGAAMQRCGHGLWWSELVDVYTMHQQLGIALRCIENNRLLHALTSCLKCKKTPLATMESRRQEALEIAKSAWGRPPPTTLADFNCGLSSALRLCSRIGSDSAYAWADDIWKKSELQPFPKTFVTYAARTCLCEQRGEYQAVSDLLMQTVRQRLSPDEVLLGGLLQEAAAHFNWKRADDIWQLFLTQHQVKPNFLTYTAYAKAHLLAGRPHVSVRIIETMLSTDTCKMDYKLAIEFAQALLLVCHSSLAPSDTERLTTFLGEGAKIIAKESAGSGKDQWQDLTSRAERLMADPSSVTFADLLITMNARELSVMKSWPNYPPGSGYLKHR